MKQFCVLHLMDSAGIFGAEVMLLNLAKAQQESGLHSIIGAIQTPDDLARNSDALTNFAKRLEIDVDPVEMPEKSLINGTMKLRTFLAKHQPDIVHSHGYKSNILLGSLKTFAAIPPVISTIHGWTATDFGTRVAIYESIDRWMLRRMDRVVVVTEQQKHHPGIRKLDSRLVACIANGTDLNWRDKLAEPESERKTLESLTNFSRGKNLIVAIGRLSPEKAHLRLIEAFAKLTSADDSLRLVIAGEGPLRRTLEQRISKLELGEKVRLPGYLERIDKLLAHAGCLVQPSLTEGLPITLLEAMGRNIPIVATRVGGVARLLDEGKLGYIIESNDNLALESSINAVFTNKRESAQRAALAYQRFVTEYSARHMADQYHSIYLDCVGK